MSQINKQTEVAAEEAAAIVEDARPVAPPSRRRLIKLGAAAVPVVATLTSRPAFAWHCMSPAAWGSIDANPNTSLKTNAGHKTYVDETWYISDWKDNTARGATGNTKKPWAALKSKYPGLKDDTTTTSGSFDYTKVTIDKLLMTVSVLNGAGASGADTVKAVLTNGTPLQKSTIVAQLNYLILSPLSGNQMESCLAFDKLTEMASGTYYPLGTDGQAWYADEIVRYLRENWIAL
jgi:hypothetical protein